MIPSRAAIRRSISHVHGKAVRIRGSAPGPSVPHGAAAEEEADLPVVDVEQQRPARGQAREQPIP